MAYRKLDKQLREAAIAGDAYLASLLMAAGADARARGPYGDTALNLAAKHGHLACVELLMPASDARARSKMDERPKRGAGELGLKVQWERVDSERDLGYTALMWAAQYGSLDCAKALLPASDPLARGGVMGISPLMIAAMSRSASAAAIVELLAPVSDMGEVMGNMGRTALMHAAASGSRKVVEALLPWSDLSAKSAKGGLSAAELAKAMGRSEMARLIEAYAMAKEEAREIAASAGAGRPKPKNAKRRI